MTDEKKLSLIEEALGLDRGVLSRGTLLETVGNWDSIGKLFLMSMIKKECDRTIEPAAIRLFKTIGDIMNAMN
jgi:acyl carrier protein